MQERIKLKMWMDAHGYNYKTLAKELDFSYEYIYKIVLGKNDKRMSSNFKLKFIERFGWDEAGKVFVVTSLSALIPTNGKATIQERPEPLPA